MSRSDGERFVLLRAAGARHVCEGVARCNDGAGRRISRKSGAKTGDVTFRAGAAKRGRGKFCSGGVAEVGMGVARWTAFVLAADDLDVGEGLCGILPAIATTAAYYGTWVN